jgi:hypothetical protein
MADQPTMNGRANIVGWIAGPMVGTILGVIVSEFKNVSDHANRISILEVSTHELHSRIEKIDQKLDKLLEIQSRGVK